MKRITIFLILSLFLLNLESQTKIRIKSYDINYNYKAIVSSTYGITAKDFRNKLDNGHSYSINSLEIKIVLEDLDTKTGLGNYTIHLTSKDFNDFFISPMKYYNITKRCEIVKNEDNKSTITFRGLYTLTKYNIIITHSSMSNNYIVLDIDNGSLVITENKHNTKYKLKDMIQYKFDIKFSNSNIASYSDMFDKENIEKEYNLKDKNVKKNTVDIY